jgi:diaminopimelate epimerase
MVGIFVHQMDPSGITVALPGGELEIRWDPKTKIFTQSGPSVAVYSGRVEI